MRLRALLRASAPYLIPAAAVLLGAVLFDWYMYAATH